MDSTLAKDTAVFQAGNHATNGHTRRDAPLVDVQPPRAGDLQPRYAQQVADDGHGENGWYGSMIATLGSIMGSCGAVPGIFCCPNPFRPVEQGYVGLITTFGRFTRAVDPGLVRVNPLSEKLIKVDVKIQVVEVPRQVCMTKDNVTLTLTSVIYYHITSPHRAAFGVNDVRNALVERTQTTLRHVVGSRLLQDVIERREEIAESIREIIDDTATNWGVAVESMLVKDIVFSQELQDSLSMAAQAKRVGEGKIITARAEVESAKLMRAAADILSSSSAMQIRYLEAMQAMAKSANSKVIFLPGINQSMQSNLIQAANAEVGEGPSTYMNQTWDNGTSRNTDFGYNGNGLNTAASARNVENI